MTNRRRISAVAATVAVHDKENVSPIWIPSPMTKTRLQHQQKPAQLHPLQPPSIQHNLNSHYMLSSLTQDLPMSGILQHRSFAKLRPDLISYQQVSQSPRLTEPDYNCSIAPLPLVSRVEKSFVRYPKEQSRHSMATLGSCDNSVTARNHNRRKSSMNYNSSNNSCEISDLKQLKSFLLAGDSPVKGQVSSQYPTVIVNPESILLPSQLDVKSDTTKNSHPILECLSNQASVVSFKDDHLTAVKVSTASTAPRTLLSRSSHLPPSSQNTFQPIDTPDIADSPANVEKEQQMIYGSQNNNYNRKSIELPQLQLSKRNPIPPIDISIIGQSQQKQPMIDQLCPLKSTLNNRSTQNLKQNKQATQRKQQNHLLSLDAAHHMIDPLEAALFQHLSARGSNSKMTVTSKNRVNNATVSLPPPHPSTNRSTQERMHFNKEIQEALTQFKGINISSQFMQSNSRNSLMKESISTTHNKPPNKLYYMVSSKGKSSQDKPLLEGALDGISPPSQSQDRLKIPILQNLKLLNSQLDSRSRRSLSYQLYTSPANTERQSSVNQHNILLGEVRQAVTDRHISLQKILQQ